jgi:hypothetical protein
MLEVNVSEELAAPSSRWTDNPIADKFVLTWTDI